MKKLFILGIICSLIISCISAQASSNPPEESNNAIQLGKAKLAVYMLVMGETNDSTFNIDSFASEFDMYCNTRSLFDISFDGSLIPLIKERKELVVFYEEVPLECKEEVVGLRLHRNSEFQGGTECVINQDSINKFIIFISPQGQLLDCAYPIGNMMDWMSIARVGYNSQMVDPSIFMPTDTTLYDKSWEAVIDNMVNTRWPEFLKKCTGNITLPPFAENWVVNSLKKQFASSSILLYVRNADRWLSKQVASPPMEAYSFLDSINYNPDIFLKNEMNFPQSWFLGNILKYPDGGFDSIGETPVAQWKEYADKKLAPAMSERPQLLLDLLSGMSYANQINDGTPLTEIQIKNIKEGYTNDIGKIILAMNDKLLTNQKDSSNQ